MDLESSLRRRSHRLYPYCLFASVAYIHATRMNTYIPPTQNGFWELFYGFVLCCAEKNMNPYMNVRTRRAAMRDKK